MYMVPLGEALDPTKHFISIIFDPLWVCEAHGNILASIVSNSYFGKRLVARDMII